MQPRAIFSIVICSLLLSFTKAFAQEQDSNGIIYNDYVLNLKNDTIRCHIIKVKGPDSNLAVKYRIAEGQSAKTLSADSVRELFFSDDSSVYMPKYLPNLRKHGFLQVIERGKINLYQFLREQATTSTYVGISVWYASKNMDTLKIVNTSVFSLINIYHTGTRKEHKKAFMELIADNPELLARFKTAIESADFSYDLTRYYIKTYNDEFSEKHKSSQ